MEDLTLIYTHNIVPWLIHLDKRHNEENQSKPKPEWRYYQNNYHRYGSGFTVGSQVWLQSSTRLRLSRKPLLITHNYGSFAHWNMNEKNRGEIHIYIYTYIHTYVCTIWKHILKLQYNVIQKTKIMAFCPITSWQIEGENVETVTHFIFFGSKITATMKLKDTCSLEGKLWQT